MQSVLNSISQHSAALLLASLAALAVAAVALGVLARRVARLQGGMRSILEGARGETLERMLYDHLRERVQIQSEVDGHALRLDKAEERLLSAKSHVGLVRYDAFEDVGGSQSFALAVFDDRGDGAIVTSIVGRADCRVYCKPLLGGRSERGLSNEEQRAIDEARNPGPRSILSP